MRWPWSRRRPVEPVDLDTIDPAELEVVEIDEHGRPAGPHTVTRHEPMRETAYATGADGTGLAGIWAALEAES